MTKLRIQGALYLFILLAAMVVFSNAGSSGTVLRGQADSMGGGRCFAHFHFPRPC